MLFSTKKKSKLSRFLSGVLGLLLLTAFTVTTTEVVALGNCDDKLPDDILIIPPKPEVPAELAAWSGIWHGKWGGTLCSSLAIELIEENGNVRFVYSWGRLESSFDPGFMASKGKIVDNELGWGSRVKLLFKMNIDKNIIDGEYHGRGLNFITMKKMTDTNK
ncbi:MAG: hypothetical protein HOK30_00710 [Rhodospirillaceae bacterium]|nr:hypothetical protein [Rhodospirillaceae bacterium]